MYFAARIIASAFILALGACASGRTSSGLDQAPSALTPEPEAAEVSTTRVGDTELVGTWIYDFSASSRDYPVLFQSMEADGRWMDYAEEGRVVQNAEDGYETTAIATMTIMGGASPVAMQFLIEHSGNWDLDGGRIFMIPETAKARPLNQQAIEFVEQYDMPIWLEPEGIILVYTPRSVTADEMVLQSLSPLAGIEVTMTRLAENTAE